MRVRKFLSKIRVSSLCKSLMKLILLILFFICFHHFFACIWNRLSSNQWIPPYEWIDVTLINPYKSQLYSYFESYYYGLSGGMASGEMGPQTELDLILSSLIMIIGALLNANALAFMMLLLDELNTNERKVQTKVEALN